MRKMSLLFGALYAKVSLLFSALNAKVSLLCSALCKSVLILVLYMQKCPYYLVLYMQKCPYYLVLYRRSVLINWRFICKACLLSFMPHQHAEAVGSCRAPSKHVMVLMTARIGEKARCCQTGASVWRPANAGILAWIDML